MLLRQAALVLGIIGGLTGGAQASGKPLGNTFIVRTVAFAVDEPLEGAIRKCWVSQHNYLHTVPGNSMVTGIECVPVAEPSPHIQKPLLLLYEVNFRCSEGARTTASVDGLRAKHHWGCARMVILEGEANGEWGFSELIIYMGNKVSRLGFPAIAPDGPKGPPMNDSGFGLVPRLSGSWVQFKKGLEIFDKDERLPVDFQRPLGKPALLYAGFRQVNGEPRNDTRGDGRNHSGKHGGVVGDPRAQLKNPSERHPAILVFVIAGLFLIGLGVLIAAHKWVYKK